MATTTFRRDHLLRRVLAPTSTATDFAGRLTTSTADYLGRALVATVFAGTTAVTLGQYVESATGVLYEVTVAGTTAAAAPTPPGVGSTVVSASATFRQLSAAA